MDSAQRQKLHDDMQAAFDQSNMATSAANCFPEGFNFSKMFFSSTVFKEFLEKQQKQAHFFFCIFDNQNDHLIGAIDIRSPYSSRG